MTGVLRRGLLIAMAGLVTSGCFAPQPPMFGDGRSVPTELSREPVPVRPGQDGTWAVILPEAGLFGEGRSVARLRDGERAGWRTELQAEFALTSRQPGEPHSALTHGTTTVLVGGREGRTGPSSVASLDPYLGTVAWRRELPPGTRVSLPQDVSTAVLLTTTCTAKSCRLTGWNIGSGGRLWSRTVPGPVKVLDSCRGDALALESGLRTYCPPYLVTGDRVGTVGLEDGAVRWEAGLRPPSGTVDRIARYHDRTVTVTAPAEGSCRATVLASGSGSGEGDRGWRHDFVWDQPQAPRDPETGCRWDRRIPLYVGHTMVLPDKEGALVVDPYFGTLRPGRRLAPGEYLVSEGTGRETVRAQGHPDRALSEDSGRSDRPAGLGPGSRAIGRNFWQDGDRLVYVDRGEVLWEGRSDCRAFGQPDKGGTVSYCDGGQLVRLGPTHRD